MGAKAPTLLHEVFDRSAARDPGRVAVEIPPSPQRARATFTYAEIRAASDRLADRLRAHVQGECVVAILLPRHSAELYVAQLGVMKAGAAYTCLGPTNPVELTGYVLEDSGAVAVITSAELRGHLDDVPPAAGRIIEIETVAEAAARAPAKLDPPSWLTPQSLAYVIYTSGTTGWPKGVMIEHHSIVNLVLSDMRYFDVTPDDRCAQSSSPVYDSSIEEIYFAFGPGATLVVVDDEAVRSGPDLVPWLRRERINFFSPPPTLLRMCRCDDPQKALPELRLMCVGGEALPQDLADAWSVGRRLENDYGPTECAVTVCRGRVHPGKPVTIGRLVVNNQPWILDEELNEVEVGTPGELCISGEGIARGYLNHPELTAQKFIEHPRYGRIYRTGDLVREEPSGELTFHGRIDSQVKIRGYRVELEAIEAQIAVCDGVMAAACKVQHAKGGDGAAQIIAFVVPQRESTPDLGAISRRLAETLPIFMRPAHYQLLDVLPTLASGKLDRRALPDVEGEIESAAGARVAPRNEAERLVAAAFENHLLVSSFSLDDDFFDLGGNSLVAAEVISELRQHPLTAALAVRDLYEAPTVAALAERARPDGDATTSNAVAAAPAEAPLLVSALQLAFLVLLSGGAAAGGFWLFFELLPWLAGRVSGAALLALAPILPLAGTVLYFVFSLTVAVTAKRLLIGRYQAGRFAFLGGFYLRHWIVLRLVRLVPWRLVEGTVFKNACLRLLGARIGKRVHIHGGADVLGGGWDLLEIGDDVAVGRDVGLRLVELEDQQLVIGPIAIGPRCTIDTRARLAPHSRMGAEAALTPLSFVPSYESIPAGQVWSGTPAAFSHHTRPAPALDRDKRAWSPLAAGVALVLMRQLISLALWGVPVVVAAGVLALAGSSVQAALDGLMAGDALSMGPLLAVAGSVIFSFVLAVWLRALVMRLLGRVRPGHVSRWGWTYLVVQLKTELLDASGHAINGMLLWPLWLRLAGMKVGPKCEISTIIDAVPELITIDEQTFFADGIYLGSPHIDRGVVSLRPTSLGRNTFLGNHAVIPGGAQLPPDILVGIGTVADAAQIREGTSWFGQPAFELPRRQLVEMDRRLTHDPTPLRYLSRLVWELSRLLLPAVPAVAMVVMLTVASTLAERQQPAQLYLLTLPLLSVAMSASLLLYVALLKWVLLGRVRSGQHGLWTFWVSRWEVVYTAWGLIASPLMQPLEGTLLLNWWLRAMGVRIGSRVMLGSGFAQVVDPDMLAFESGSTVACLFQAHSFEDHVLKIAPLHIRAGATAGSGAVLLYGVDIGERAIVACNSVVMKNELLSPGRYYIGSPTRGAVAPTPPPTARPRRSTSVPPLAAEVTLKPAER